MRTFQESSITPSECRHTFNVFMRKLFRKGERVRSKIDGKVMEVLKYIKNNFVEVRWFDLEKKEIRVNKIKEDKLSKAA